MPILEALIWEQGESGNHIYNRMAKYMGILLILFLLNQEGSSQFLGGSGDGYDRNQVKSPINIYVGGVEDGYAAGKYKNTISIFAGGVKDGYSSSEYSNTISIFFGGEEDGFASEKYHNTISIFSGGDEDGYDLAKYKNVISIYAGGEEDGYDLGEDILSYFWTGNIGTGWNVGGNWSTGIIPTINSNVVIPANATNFPFINAGLMSIGQNNNSGIYLCNRINVRYGAEMTLKMNTILENYGFMQINGTVYGLNNATNAVQNFSGGEININGSWIFQ